MSGRFAKSRRRGLTLIEVLVSLGIMGLILAVLVVPNIVRSRELARQNQCRDNLKQLGLALHNYHDTFKNTFPPGYVIDPNGVYHGWGWQLLLQPYLESSKRYSEISGVFSGGLQQSPRHTRFMDDIRCLRCPSDSGASSTLAHVIVCDKNVVKGVVTPGTLDVPDHFGRSNYFGMAGYLGGDLGGIYAGASGPTTLTEPLVNAGSLGNSGRTFSADHRYCDQKNFHGVFGQNSHIGIRNISDGTSNTIMVGERYAPASANVGAIGHGTWVGVPDCTSTAGLAMALGDTSLPMNAGANKRLQTTGFGSLHGDGANFLFGDGAVRFISTKISIQTYRALSQLDDAQIICEF